jgi:putative membrane protein
LASGSSALAKGAAEIDEGARTLGKGITTLNDSVTANAFSPAPLKKGTKDLSDGSNKLVPGITSLAEGLDRLDKGIGSLSDGARVLAQGNRDLESGTLTLSAGLNLLYEKIPDTISLPIESPQAMALGVQIIEEKTDPQPNNGHGFASYFICINLWIGALLTTFILPFRTLPGSARRSSQTAKVSAKLVTPILIACLQGVSMVWGMSLFGVHFANPAAAFGAAVLMSCAFVFVIYALIAIAADAGRLLCLILTIVQAACAGGSFPLELAGPFYQVSHEIVPMRFGLDGIRFAISGALGSQFGANMLKLGLTIVICAVLMSIGRFKWIYSEGETIESIISI